jgi:hypothetical protein
MLCSNDMRCIFLEEKEVHEYCRNISSHIDVDADGEDNNDEAEDALLARGLA